MHVRIKKLDVHTIKPHRITLLLGRRGSGKSVLLRDLLYNSCDRYDFAMAMCPTMESSQLLKECMPKCCVFDRYMQSKIDALVRVATETTAQGKGRSFLLILDDVMYDKAICRTQSFRYLFYNGRHAKISVMILLQYLTDMPPDMRTQVDYVYTMKENTIQNRMKLYKMFFGVFDTFEDFTAVLDRCTQNYETLMLDNTLQSNGPADCIFWYKAKMDNPSFQLCRPIYYHLENKYKRSEPAPLNLEDQQGATGKNKNGKARLHVTKDPGSDDDEPPEEGDNDER